MTLPSTTGAVRLALLGLAVSTGSRAYAQPVQYTVEELVGLGGLQKAINVDGTIVGFGTQAGVAGRHAVLLRPVNPADLDGDARVDRVDAALMWASRGPCLEAAPCPADLTGDGVVDRADAERLAAFRS